MKSTRSTKARGLLFPDQHLGSGPPCYPAGLMDGVANRLACVASMLVGACGASPSVMPGTDDDTGESLGSTSTLTSESSTTMVGVPECQASDECDSGRHCIAEYTSGVRPAAHDFRCLDECLPNDYLPGWCADAAACCNAEARCAENGLCIGPPGGNETSTGIEATTTTGTTADPDTGVTTSMDTGVTTSMDTGVTTGMDTGVTTGMSMDTSTGMATGTTTETGDDSGAATETGTSTASSVRVERLHDLPCTLGKCNAHTE